MADAAGKELDNTHGESMFRPLQIVEIELAESAWLINQPENWIVGHAPWIQRGNIEAHEVGGYLDAPETLWGIGDRIAYSEIENRNIKIAQSLYLVSDVSIWLRLADTPLSG
uniref:Dual OB-containing domain-containing protein n=1 Tax=Candidatus Kentrum sp. FM TaxID=2126340 RepID=A0A450U027_9GAMM|nr:MAG: hypothetical protein BECKFM1743C_GA0114222_108162 [Candidatus Kentron sp. FM]VFJ75591.1 MAG: hypothetical protein BECKFM1743A_GA0114220_108492 [Candidatus Kentron sp. FM]VFK23369.1 MAG: hypothetical protein BECKFM1743B_GA0114221_109212 [Candidatus Kentron sp. FM]